MPAVLVRVSTITDKGQTTVPKPVREALGVGHGDRIAYRIDERGVTLHRATDEQDDPVVGAFLGFLAEEMQARPGTIVPLAPSLMERVRSLIDGVEVDEDEEIEGDVGL
jgi:antitoxin PrlF